MIRIAKELSLPLDAVTQTFAEIARKGGGKTYLATMIAEGMLDAKAQVIAIDPVGIWWGLRVDADGKSKGKDIYVIGGEHGDVPIAPEAGKEIARILAETGVSCVLDVSEMRKHERKKFLTDFGEEFFHLKKSHRTPVHIFLEEAHTTIPQRVERDDARMVGAWEDIVRLGRNYGIGCSLITQRPQSVNKEVLSQVECLCVLQVTGLHERKALEEWVQEAGADRKLTGELPGLARGEGFVWSPGWLKIFKRVHFLQKTTFDTSATPKLGEAAKTAKISKVDVEKLRSIMKEVVAKAEAEKMKEKTLIEENKRLKTELAFAKKATVKLPTTDPQAIAKAEQRGYERGKFEASNQCAKQLKSERHAHKQTLIAVRHALKTLTQATAIEQYLESPLPEVKAPVVIKNTTSSTVFVEPRSSTKLSKEPMQTMDAGDVTLSKPQKAILESLAKLAGVGQTEARKETVAALSRMSSRGGYFMNTVGSLRTAGYIRYPQPGLISLTDQGASMVSVEPLTSDEELQEGWKSIMSAAQKKLFDVLLEAHPQPLDKEELASRAGMTTSGGYFMNTLGSMRTMGAIDYPQPKTVALTSNVFIRG